MLKSEQGAEMGRLAARLVEKRWRDKEVGEEAKKIEALARAHGFEAKEEDKEEEEPKAGAKRPMAVEEEEDSGDI